jgi:hypothetical protein
MVHAETAKLCLEVLMGSCMERSVKMVIRPLGILKAGGAHMLLDPADP